MPDVKLFPISRPLTEEKEKIESSSSIRTISRVIIAVVVVLQLV